MAIQFDRFHRRSIQQRLMRQGRCLIVVTNYAFTVCSARSVLVAWAQGALVLALLTGGGQLHAADCRNFRISIYNHHPVKIRVQSVRLIVQGKSWQQKVGRKIVRAGRSISLKNLKPGFLQIGQAPRSIDISFERWDIAKHRWLKKQVSQFRRRAVCQPGQTYYLDLRQ